jgi:hypothetical protein
MKIFMWWLMLRGILALIYHLGMCVGWKKEKKEKRFGYVCVWVGKKKRKKKDLGMCVGVGWKKEKKEKRFGGVC